MACCTSLACASASDKLVRDVVLNDAAPFVPLGDREAQAETSDYGAKAVEAWLGSATSSASTTKQAAKDAADRAAILASLERQLAQAATRRWSATPAIRRFLKTVGDGHFAIDRSQGRRRRPVRRRVRAAYQHRSQLRWLRCCATSNSGAVEQTFRTAKHLLATRPIFHKLDETIRGHVFCSFLALVLKAELDARIAALGQTASWPAIIADLDALTETEVEQDSKRFHAAFHAQDGRQPCHCAPPASRCRQPCRLSPAA